MENNTNTQLNNVLPAKDFDGGALEYLLLLLMNTVLIGIPIINLIGTPFAILKSWEYEVNHTILNGKRMQFVINFGEFILVFYKVLFLTIITLGIYSLWGYAEVQRYKIKNTNY